MPPSDDAAAARSAAESGLELLRGMRGLGGKLAQWFELLPERERPRFAWREPEPLSRKQVERVLAGAWEEPVARVLDELDDEPAALASTGQVHRGQLDGRPVAIKVQRPGVEDAVRAELDVFLALAAVAARVLPGLDAGAIARELRDRALEELDHEIEAQAQRAFARAFRGHPFIHVPAPDTTRSTHRVLVADWVEGRRLDALLDAPDAERDRIGEALFRFHLGAPHRMGRLHADPHPSNVVVEDDGRIAMLDYGAVLAPGRERMADARALLAAGLAQDAQEAHSVFERLGYLRRPDAVDPQEMLETGRDLLAPVLDAGPVRVDARELGRMAAQIERDERIWRILGALSVPPEDLLLRRTELSTMLLLALVRARADWGAIGRELWAGAPPATALGEAEAAFWARRRR